MTYAPAMPFAVERIDHIVLRVRDLARSEEFYSAVLGCSMVKRRDDLGLVHLRAGHSMLDLISVDGKLGKQGGTAPAREGRNVDHLCLKISPFDEQAILKHLRHLNLTPRAPVAINFGAEGEGPSLYFEDPDGNVIELKGPRLP